jgi:adenine-specific DNA-methyltransferase
MATGLPARARDLAPTARAAARVELAYEGKRSREEILRQPGPPFETLWDGGGEDRLYCADNLHVLRGLRHDPAVAGKVRLVYIDPPFATRSSYRSRRLDAAYDDLHTGASYVEQLRERLILLRELLAGDGSIYLHLDEKMVFEMKLVMDEVFGPENYRNCIVRKKCNPKNYTRRAYGNVADFILFYTRSGDFVFNRPVEPRTAERSREYRHLEADTGRRYMKVPLHAPGTRNGATGMPWRGKPPPPGKHWQYPPHTLDEMDARGEIVWSASGNPRRKVYLDESRGVPVQDIWTEFRDAHNQNIGITGYPTEKNADLLARIVEASSNPGDLVLDCYAGSGTTLAAAARLSRRWIGVDDSVEALRTMLRRFLEGTAPMGDFVGARRPRSARPARMPLFERSGVAPPRAHPGAGAFRLLGEVTRDEAIDAAVRRFADRVR